VEVENRGDTEPVRRPPYMVMVKIRTTVLDQRTAGEDATLSAAQVNTVI